VALPVPVASFQINPLLYKLPIGDQAEFLQLVNNFAYSEDRNKRNLGMPTFVKHLTMVHSFVCRGDSFDALRGVVCGLEFGANSFLINISHLKRLMFRSKSCMNGCFQKLGYTVCRPAQDAAALLSQILPSCGPHIFTARHWSVRRAGPGTTLRFLPSTTIDLASAEPLESEDSSPRPAARTAPIEATKSFGYDIQSLLNHRHPDSDILRMSDVQVPPIRF
jgi:hypothetical protein